MVNVKIFDPNEIKIGEKSYKNILINHIEYVTIKDSRCATITSVNPLYIVINKKNRYIEESNANRYWKLVPTDESKDTR